MPEPITDSEKFVFRICQESCLNFWCYNNPVQPNGKELCDVLVVFGPHVLIISVKDIGLNEEDEDICDEDLLASHKRWNRKAVENSVNQIYGAERSLKAIDYVLPGDRSQGAKLPDLASRKIHRIAVAFGSRGETAIVSKDYGKGLVHVMNEGAFETILTELDTITDLTEYLQAKEFLAKNTGAIIFGGEVNLLACYLANNRKFSFDAKALIVEEGMWQKLQADPAFQNGKVANKISYEWDRLISWIASADSKDIEGKALTLSEKDLALREMAKETRIDRRALQIALTAFLKAGTQRETDARVVMRPGASCVYVFRYFHFSDKSQEKIAELQIRCMRAKKQSETHEAETAVGIGFAWDHECNGYEITLAFVPLSAMTPEESDAVHIFASDNGIGQTQVVSEMTVDEYPQS